MDDKVFNKEIVYRAIDTDKVQVIKNINYRQHRENARMDLYAACHKTPLPAVLLVHGEAKSISSMKDAGQYCSWGRVIAASGYTAVAFNHRVLSDGFSMEAVTRDIDDLIQYVIINADNLGIDKNRIAIWSFSGGVPFGMYAGLSGYFGSVKCILSYYGFGDFEYMGRFFSASSGTETLDGISKAVQKNADLIPPILIARAGLDNKLLNESMDNFIAEALRHNLSVDVYNHATGGHAFDLFCDNDRTHEILSKSLDFLKTHLG